MAITKFLFISTLAMTIFLVLPYESGRAMAQETNTVSEFTQLFEAFLSRDCYPPTEPVPGNAGLTGDSQFESLSDLDRLLTLKSKAELKVILKKAAQDGPGPELVERYENRIKRQWDKVINRSLITNKFPKGLSPAHIQRFKKGPNNKGLGKKGQLFKQQALERAKVKYQSNAKLTLSTLAGEPEG